MTYYFAYAKESRRVILSKSPPKLFNDTSRDGAVTTQRFGMSGREMIEALVRQNVQVIYE